MRPRAPPPPSSRPSSPRAPGRHLGGRGRGCGGWRCAFWGLVGIPSTNLTSGTELPDLLPDRDELPGGADLLEGGHAAVRHHELEFHVRELLHAETAPLPGLERLERLAQEG